MPRLSRPVLEQYIQDGIHCQIHPRRAEAVQLKCTRAAAFSAAFPSGVLGGMGGRQQTCQHAGVAPAAAPPPPPASSAFWPLRRTTSGVLPMPCMTTGYSEHNGRAGKLAVSFTISSAVARPLCCSSSGICPQMGQVIQLCLRCGQIHADTLLTAPDPGRSGCFGVGKLCRR